MQIPKSKAELTIKLRDLILKKKKKKKEVYDFTDKDPYILYCLS